MVDFIGSELFDPLANDKENFENYQNYQNIANLATTKHPPIPPRRSTANDPTVDDVFAPIQPPAMPGIHSTPAPSSQKSFNANYRTLGHNSYMNGQPTLEQEPLLSPIPRQVRLYKLFSSFTLIDCNEKTREKFLDKNQTNQTIIVYNLPINRTFFIENIDVCFMIDIYT